MKKKTFNQFHRLSKNAQEKYLETITDRAIELREEADELLNHVAELDENYAQQTTEYLNENY